MKDLTCFEPKFKTLGGYLRGYERPQTLEDVLKDISEKTHISVELIKSKSRVREIAEARMFYFVRAKMLLPMYSLKKIGGLVNRTHCTVMWGIDQVNEIPSLRKKYIELFGI